MKVMILSAGRGERMRPLTDNCPKPLLSLNDHETLIERHIRRLAECHFNDIIINCAWLPEKIQSMLGNGSRYHVNIQYSIEQAGGLETAGGIAKALPLLGNDPFLVINGDIFTDINFQLAYNKAQQLLTEDLWAFLWLVPNPSHHLDGDFSIDINDYLIPPNLGYTSYTFSGVGVYQPKLFDKIQIGEKVKLAPLLHNALKKQKIKAEVWQNIWLDVGTVERLNLARQISDNLLENG